MCYAKCGCYDREQEQYEYDIYQRDDESGYGQSPRSPEHTDK